MPPTQDFLLAAHHQLLQRILADRLQEGEAWLAIRLRVLLEETVLEEGLEAIQDINPKVAGGIAHGLRRRQRPAPHKNGQPHE
jgi:hypothetical protein